MGDLEADTAVEAVGDGCYRGVPSPEWEIWGPMGGYIASFGSGRRLRHVAHAAVDVRLPLPRGGPVRAHRRPGRGPQGGTGRQLVPRRDHPGWAADPRRVGVDHDGGRGPRARRDRAARGARPRRAAEHRGAGPRRCRAPVPVLAELRRKAARVRGRLATRRPSPGPVAGVAAVPADVDVRGPLGRRGADGDPRRPPELALGPPAARLAGAAVHRPHARPERHVPQPTAGEEWLLCDGAAPLSTGGQFGWTARVWSTGGGLLASGGGQCLYRRMRPPTP